MTTFGAVPKRKLAIAVGIGAGLLLLIGANAHLVYVAATSQPDCVAHVRQGEEARGAVRFSAAKSACSPR